jgi:acetate kinase
MEHDAERSRAVARILTINSGSSSIKFSVYEAGSAERLVLAGSLERIGQDGGQFRAWDGAERTIGERTLALPDHAAALRVLLEWLPEHLGDQRLDGVGHRVVHGGRAYAQPHRITPEVMAKLRDLLPLAPEHLPHELKAIEAIGRAYPDLPQVACFDTAFHRGMPDVAQRYALPQCLHDEGVLRYGFHGLSYEYIMSELRREAGDAAADGRVIVAHLGNGASLAAVRGGRSVDTTMGFTPTGGLVMSTRSGDLDPSVPLYLIGERGMDAAAVRTLVNHQAGLLGVSGVSADMRDLLERERSDPRAALAVALFCYQARKYIGALAAALGGLDTLIFTAGIGEHAAAIRWRICQDLGFLGIALDPVRNDAHVAIISREGGPVTVRVMPTNEELMIARHTAGVLASPAG